MTMEKLETILVKDENGKFQLYACRGVGKGCQRNKHRSHKAQCNDCFGPLDENMTLEDVVKRLQRGDA